MTSLSRAITTPRIILRIGPNNILPALVLVALLGLVSHALCSVGHDTKLPLAALRGKVVTIQRPTADLTDVEHIKAVLLEIVMRVFSFQVLGVFVEDSLIIGQGACCHGTAQCLTGSTTISKKC
ncbi:hypothetical protein BKA67DRAFT_242969 [Truncatella angustata]|uniref:Uncharacterized protein n=1 Tax=Truncatella angustata TaxID=152316 RepID=A0A9P8UNM1_9PEZI|nr:uncharacterized protein BKA67DRAFT_242969 [Truncatella angustata]KAH6655591.1 hypothetical protein BKA67DRAFT_242969 [Truncatella angustata]